MGTLRTLGLMMAVTLVLTAAVQMAGAENAAKLSEHWALRSAADVTAKGEAISAPGFITAGWYPTSVPATVLAALVENKVYPDPFFGENMKQIPGYKAGRWLVMPQDSPFFPAWWYRTEFDLPASLQGKNLVLHVDGINYRANVWLNGKRVADSDTVVGMFRRFEFDINEFAKPGQKNCLALEVTGPGHIPEKSYRSKQVEATTGWDDHNPQPPDLNTGVWQDVYITATGPVALRNPYVATKLDLPSLAAARLTVSTYAVNKSAQKVKGTLTGTIEKISFSQDVELGPKETKLLTFTPEAFKQLNVSQPRVWWPADVGTQELYDLQLRFAVNDQESDTLSTRFGIREATTYINDEGWRGYRINGKNILIRGGAWMTSDMLLRLTPKRYDALVRYAKEAHFNMLRSEGFSIRETEDFYNTCDKYGVMVTQQIFGRSIPDEALAVSCVEDMMLRVRNHPSLVHFLGHDETFPTETLDKAYRDLIAKYMPDRTYQPHSGAFELEERFETGGTRTGSLQVWTYATPAHYYTSKETGAWGFAQSGGIGGIFAPLESMRRMVPPEALKPPQPWTDPWSFHTVIQTGTYFNAVIKAINDRFGPSSGIEDFMQKALALNYESARGMFEAYGRNKYSATGITTWKYDAAWPASPTWQYVDWYLIAGGAYYGAKKACEPLHVQYSYDDESVWIVNSFYKPHSGLKVTAKLLNLDLAEKWTQTATVDVAEDAKTKAFTVERPKDLTKTFFLILRLEDKDGKPVTDNFYWLSTVPDTENTSEDSDLAFTKPVSTADYTDMAKLPPVKLNVTSTHAEQGAERTTTVTVDNPSKNLAFFVHLAVTQGENGPEVAPTYWNQNYFSLLPGEKREVRATYATEDLANKPPAIKLDGWNVSK